MENFINAIIEKCGTIPQYFFCRGWAGDEMEEIYNDGRITVLYCRFWSYIEILGLTEIKKRKFELFCLYYLLDE